MSKMRPHFSMIIFYWAIMVAVESIVLLLILDNAFKDIRILLIGLLVLMMQCFVFMLVFCNLPYFVIELGEASVTGPSQFGFGWRKVEIPYTEFSHIVNNQLLSMFGFYYIKSTQGKIISVMGFTEGQYKKLLETIAGKNKAA